MEKLQFVKCPRCDSDIKVNASTKKVKCKYCDITILISENENDNKKGNMKKEDKEIYLENARKLFEKGKYLDAKHYIDELLKEDDNDIRVCCELIKIDLMLLKKDKYDLKVSYCNEKYDENMDNYYEEFKATYEKLKEINDKKVENYLSLFKNDINYIEKIQEEIENRKEKNEKIIDKLNDDYEEIKKYGYFDEYKKVMHETFKCSKNITKINYSFEKGCSDAYELVDYADLTIDGILFGNYKKITNNYSANKNRITIYTSSSKFANSFEEIDERFEKYNSKIAEVINIAKEKKARQDEKDEKYRKRHYYLNIFYLILCAMAFLTLFILHVYILVKGEFGFLIAIAVVVDSWLVNLLVTWFESSLDNLEIYKKKKNSI